MKKILLVDDEPDILKLVAARLRASGYDVVTAQDGQDGLRMAQQERPDLLILDLMLPHLNGYEICTMLKQDPRYQGIPVILFSAKSQEKDKQLGKDCGADAYLTKPYRPEVLLERVRTLIAQSPPPPAAPPAGG